MGLRLAFRPFSYDAEIQDTRGAERYCAVRKIEDWPVRDLNEVHDRSAAKDAVYQIAARAPQNQRQRQQQSGVIFVPGDLVPGIDQHDGHNAQKRAQRLEQPESRPRVSDDVEPEKPGDDSDLAAVEAEEAKRRGLGALIRHDNSDRDQGERGTGQIPSSMAWHFRQRVAEGSALSRAAGIF